MGVVTESLHNEVLVVLSVVIAATQSAPQLLGYPYGLGDAHTITHAVPTTVKKTFTYKTAAFEPVEADTPADAKLIELKETEHSYDALVPGPVKYVSSVVPASLATIIFHTTVSQLSQLLPPPPLKPPLRRR